MKLTIICGAFSGGGAERVAVNLANHYQSQGDYVQFLVFSEKGPYRSELDKNIKLVVLNKRARYAYLALRRFFKKDRSDCYLSVTRETSLVVGLSALGLGKRLLYREANTIDAVYSYPWFKRFSYLWFMRLNYRFSEFVICNSDDTKNDLVKHGLIEEDKGVVVENPVLPSVDVLKSKLSCSAPHPWLNDTDLFVFLNVGRLHVQKNQELLIKAFSRVHKLYPNSRLLILGDGVLKYKLIDHAKNLGVAEVFEILGFDKNPFPYYKKANAFVLSSLYEGFGNVLVEALSSGIPVISTDCPGGPNKILRNGEFGTLVRNNNCESLEYAMKMALENPRKIDALSQVNYACRFSISEVAPKYKKLLLGEDVLDAQQ